MRQFFLIPSHIELAAKHHRGLQNLPELLPHLVEVMHQCPDTLRNAPACLLPAET